MEDKRNIEVTNRIFEILNSVKGFEAAVSNCRNGKILTRYNGVSFIIDISPIFNDNDRGKIEENKTFSEVVRNNSYMLK